MQQANITNGDRTNVQVHWHTSIGKIPPSSTEYTMLVAHEFFDALPIHVLQVIQPFPPSFKRGFVLIYLEN